MRSTSAQTPPAKTKPLPPQRGSQDIRATTPAAARPAASPSHSLRPSGAGRPAQMPTPGPTAETLVQRFLRKPPSLSREQLRTELSGPMGPELVRLLSQTLPARASELVPLLCEVPGAWDHPQARVLLSTTAFDPQLGKPVLDCLKQLASGRGEKAGWAGHFLVDRALAYDPDAAAHVAALLTTREPSVVGPLKSAAQSTSTKPDAHRRACELLAAAGLPLPLRAAERFGAALGKNFGPGAVVEQLIRAAANGDDASLTTLLQAARTSSSARGALRDAYDLTSSAWIRDQLAPQIETWSDLRTPADFDRAVDGARRRQPKAIAALIKEVELSSVLKPEANLRGVEVLEELARSGVEQARLGLLGLRIDHTSSAALILAKSHLVKSPDEAKQLLDGLQTSLHFGSPEVSAAAGQALVSHRGQVTDQHLGWLLDGLRRESVRAMTEKPVGQVPLAPSVAALMTPELRTQMRNRLDEFSAHGVVEVLRRAGPMSENDMYALGRVFNNGPGPGRDAVTNALLGELPNPVALAQLSTPAFKSLSTEQQQQVVAAALSKVDPSARLKLLEQLPVAGAGPRLTELGAKYQAELAAAVAAAPKGSNLWKLGQTMAALKLAESPSYRGRIDVDAARAQVVKLTAQLEGTLEALRSKVRSSGASLIDEQAKYVEGPAFKLRAQLLPPEERARFAAEQLSVLNTLAPERSRMAASARFSELPAEQQGAVLDLVRASAGAGAELPSEASLRQHISEYGKLATEPASQLAKGGAKLGKLPEGTAKLLDKVHFALVMLKVDPSDTWSMLDAGKGLADLALAGVETAATRLSRTALAEAAGTLAGALALYDGVKAGIQAADEFKNGDVVGGVARIGSGAGSLGMAVGVALAASNPVGWTVLGISAATWLGSEAVDMLLGESELDTRLRQLGLLKSG